MGNNNGAFHYSNAHSNFTVKWPFKTEHSAFKEVVTRVTLPKLCDSCYICDSRYDVQDSMVWYKKTRHVKYCYYLLKYYKKEENNNFQCQFSRISFYMEKNPHFRDSRYITVPADV